MTFGNWKPSTNKRMINQIRLHAARIANQIPIHHAHIRAHSGFKWNEVADELANQGARS